MAVAALVLPDRLDKPSLVLAGQPETEVREPPPPSYSPPLLINEIAACPLVRCSLDPVFVGFANSMCC